MIFIQRWTSTAITYGKCEDSLSLKPVKRDPFMESGRMKNLLLFPDLYWLLPRH